MATISVAPKRVIKAFQQFQASPTDEKLSTKQKNKKKNTN